MSNSSRLKLLHLDTGRELRGGQRQLLLLARKLRERGHQQLIVCPEGSALEVRARQQGLALFDLPAHDPLQAHGTLQLRQQLLAEPVDVIHAHDGRGQTLAWLASASMSVARVASRRVTFLPGRTWLHRVKYQHTCDAIIAVSEHIRELLIRSGVPQAKIEVIPDGIEAPSDLPDVATRRHVRAQWGFSDDDFVVGHIGAFTREKGQDIALQAMALLKASRVCLVLVGRGPLRDSPEVIEGLQKARERVRLIDYVEDLSHFFAGIDLFIMPSRAEGLGSAALLAMANGLPVVASRVGGLPEIVHPGQTGWLIAPESPSALADSILAAARDPQTLKRLGSAAREQVRRFSPDIMVARTEALYKRVLRPAGGAGSGSFK